MNEARVLQDPDMARDAGEGHRQRLGEVSDPRLAAPKGDEQRTARGISEGGVGAVQDLIFKQLVDYIGVA